MSAPAAPAPLARRLRGAREALRPGNVVDWFTSTAHATVSFALLRILFGVAMLVVLLPSFADRHFLWGVGSRWIEPEAKRRGWWEVLRMIFPKDDPFRFDLLYFTLLALVFVFIAGYATRWVAPLVLLLWVALSTNSTLLTNGGDTLMRIALLFAVFARMSDHLSVDAWLRSRRERRMPAPWRPIQRRGWVGNVLHNGALILCCYQILLVYLVSSVLKLDGPEWRGGTALYYALSLDEFRVLPQLSDLVSASAVVIGLGTWLALLVQLLFPIALLWRPTRYAAVVLMTATHLGIGLLLGLWPFSLAMIALDLLLIRDRSWRSLRSTCLRAARAMRAEFVRPRPAIAVAVTSSAAAVAPGGERA